MVEYADNSLLQYGRIPAWPKLPSKIVQSHDDDDFVGFRSLRALGIHGMDHKRERIGYKEILVQAPGSSSNKSPWFFNVLGVKHRYTRGYLWVSNQFTSSWVGNTRCLRNFTTRPGIEPRTSGLIVQRFTTTPSLHSCPKSLHELSFLYHVWTQSGHWSYSKTAHKLAPYSPAIL